MAHLRNGHFAYNARHAAGRPANPNQGRFTFHQEFKSLITKSGEKSGLTVVELVVALAVLAVILTVIYQAFLLQERTSRAAAEDRELFGTGQALLDRLIRDLNGAWLPQTANPNARLVYRFEGAADHIDLASTAAMAPDQTGPEIVEVGYRLKPRESGDPGQSLIRRQDENLDDKFDQGGVEITLTRNAVRLELTYRAANATERTTWEARSAAELPRAIRVVLVLVGAAGRQESFWAMVSPPLAQGRVKPPPGVKGLELKL